MIALDHYWMGRDRRYSAELTHEIIQNAQFLLDRVNAVLDIASAEGVEPMYDGSGSCVASGWRPAGVNDATANAAKGSAHLVGLGVDLRDAAPDRPLARWCLRNLHVLESAGLYMEDPRWTWNAPHGTPWVHLQTRAPRSGNRVFIPSTAPALAAALPEQLHT